MWFSILLLSALAILFPSHAQGQTATGAAPTAAGAAPPSGTDAANDRSQPTQPKPAEAQQALPESPRSQHEKAEQELKQQEHQRFLGLIPNFNTSNIPDAASLTPSQKFRLAFRSAVDPFQFVAAGVDAGISQAEDDFSGYGQGAQGYGKRFGAAYADGFSGTIWGSAVFPVLLHEDPRYFRKGTGGFKKRFWYAVSTIVWAKRDNGTWGPNYANVLGNITAGGLSNIYYPSTDRGVGLTLQRAFTVTAEGTIGSLFTEFGPDIMKRVFHKQPNTPPVTAPAPK
jgi:hypothetical protein